jgi:hydrogenase/urease accessory protein HupE
MNIRFTQAAFWAFLAFLLPLVTSAHPTPDIPVRTFFPGDGSARVTVEVDPRCLDADPNLAASLPAAKLGGLSPAQKADLEKQAAALVQKSVEFFFEPLGRVQPEFAFQFTAKGGDKVTGTEDVVVMTGEWRTTLAAGLTGWRIRATPLGTLSVVFQNIVRGEVHPRLAVLFPGETSFTLDLLGLNAAQPLPGKADRVSSAGSARDGWSTFLSFIRQGFVHVVPLGLDHILFVLGLFLLSRNWSPLIAQVTTFTLAHSATLGLATMGLVKVPANIVEPVIAASIAAVALENIFRPRYTRWRLVLVFCFGLIHGLGFASALSDLDLPGSSLALGLVGFNLGVEGGQLAVICGAFFVTAWLTDPRRYRHWVVIPGSASIALLGAWWTVERIFGA